MNLTLKVKLCPDEGQYKSLLTTMERFNDACNYVSEVAFEHRLPNKIKLQKLIYREVRERFGLSAQLAIRAIAKVVEVYKRDRNVMPRFKPHGAVVYDQRILSWKGIDRVSILTVDGRLKVPVVVYEYFKNRANRIRGQADLILVDGIFYLCVIVEVPDGAVDERRTHKVLGVDLGVVNIAADSDGEVYTGKSVEDRRYQLMTLKARLQSCGTKSAKRHLKKLSGHEQRFRRDVNHVISKNVVAKALDTGRGIALEDLRGIRARAMVKRSQRDRHMKWSFDQLRQFIGYKASLSGVPVFVVDPAYTSQTCPVCGHIAKANRNGQSFSCVQCGHAGHADHIAAINIAGAAVNRPIVSVESVDCHQIPPGTSPNALAWGS